jgi:hypothetical protein
MGTLSLAKPLLALCLVKQLSPVGSLILAVDGFFVAATMFVLFWMCRSSLRGQRDFTV